MRVVIFYDEGEEYESIPEVKDFDSSVDMIGFINSKSMEGKHIYGMYEVYKEIEIEPFEKVINYKIK